MAYKFEDMTSRRGDSPPKPTDGALLSSGGISYFGLLTPYILLVLIFLATILLCSCGNGNDIEPNKGKYLVCWSTRITEYCTQTDTFYIHDNCVKFYSKEHGNTVISGIYQITEN